MAGQTLPINQNQALFSLLGTTYGGNGQTNFALPDLRSRVPVHRGNNFTQGQSGGQEYHTLTQAESPAHNHLVQALSSPATSSAPAGNFLAAPGVDDPCFVSGAGDTFLVAGTVAPVGGSQPHSNMQPYLVVQMIIALQGIFPSHS